MDIFEIARTVCLPLRLAAILFSRGVRLTGADFARVVTRPGTFLFGATSQVLLVPVVTFGVMRFFDIQGDLALGGDDPVGLPECCHKKRDVDMGPRRRRSVGFPNGLDRSPGH